MSDTTKKVLLADPEDWQFDVYLFEEEVNLDEIMQVVEEHKKEKPDEWNLDSLQEVIKSKYKVAEILMFDDIAHNLIDVNKSIK